MRKIKMIKGYILPAWMMLIVILALVFPFKIFIEDALSLEVMTEFGIEISIWRIIFEPVLGPLLFFNRSLYALQELPFVLIWIFILFLIFFND